MLLADFHELFKKNILKMLKILKKTNKLNTSSRVINIFNTNIL